MNFFNTDNCFYYYDGIKKDLLLLGSSDAIFINILNNFKSLKTISLILTHLNSDAGNLPSLISYCNAMYGLKPEIVFPSEDLINVLKENGTLEKQYLHSKTHNLIESEVRTFNKSYNYILKIDGQKVYYCIDSVLLTNKVLYKFICRDIKKIYYNVTRFENIPVETVSYLSNHIPRNLRKYVYARGFSSLRTKILAIVSGFSIA